MKGVARRRQIKNQNSSSTFPTTTCTGSNLISPHELETNTQEPPVLSDVFSRLECELSEFQPAIQTSKARAAALATADQDIDAAKRLVLFMLARRNMLVPISILPAEVLARIFHFTAFSEEPYSDSLGWAYVTHVCRRWRQIALDDSTLWTHLSTYPRNKKWISERLSRARNAPLVIKLEGSISKDTFSLFVPHISHTRVLYLRDLSFLDSEIVREIKTQKAPALERLELRVAISASPMSIRHLVGHSFFKRPLPKLQSFRISEILFPWSLVPRGRLTELQVTLFKEVSTVTPKGSPHGDLNQLTDLLVNCPALEILTLENCLPSTVSELSGGQTIQLPRLLRLCLRGSSSRITNVLKMLKLSSSTRLRLNCMSENTTTHNDHLILPILSAHFNDPTRVKFRYFKIFLDHVGHEIRMFASTSLPIPHTHVIQVNLGLSFRRIAEVNNRVDILRRACDALSLSSVEFLAVHSFTPIEFINWSQIFRHCTEVTTVQVSGRGMIGVLQALTPPKLANTMARGKWGKRKRGDGDRGARAQVPDNDNKHGPAPVHVPIFPKLTSLLLLTLDFTDAVSGSGVLYDLVLSMVQWRKANKTPLTTLCINNCVIREEQAKALKKVVRDFQWDRDEG